MIRKLSLLTLAGLLLAGCSQGPEPIRWGQDPCDQCRMVLTDKTFGAEFVAAKGKIYKFDEVQELANWLAAHPQQGDAYVTNGIDGSLIPAKDATFLNAREINGPMAGSTMTFADHQAAERFASEHKLTNVRYLSASEALKASEEAHHASH